MNPITEKNQMIASGSRFPVLPARDIPDIDYWHKTMICDYDCEV